mgnify:CR=1 FL=1|tara:strand:- start:16 stop:1605 length:1590 start_codon:yes stop_codon:yes gene_type:complete
MSIRDIVRQVKPVQELYRVDHAQKVQSLLSEAQLKKDDIFKRENQKNFVSMAIAGKLVDKGGKPLPKVKKTDPLLVSIKNAKEKTDIPNTRFDTNPPFKLSDVQKTDDFGGLGGKGPSGADWENIITKHFNELVGQPDHDKAANEGADNFPNYDEMGKTLAKNILSKIGKKPITQFGGGKSKSNLSSFWTSYGASDGTPKTDMYNADYNISLKKKGGSQLASGGKGETIATFNAALEYLGKDTPNSPQINEIMKQIENNFARLTTKYSKGALEGIESDKTKRKGLSAQDKKALSEYITTEKFHKELNQQIKKHLTFEKQPDFLKWYTYEAMSGYKKFAISKGKASVCLEFDADNGSVSKFIEVTKGGKSKGLTDNPDVSSDVIGISKKVKVYAAWKSSGKNPYSTLRLGLTNDYTTNDTIDTFQNIIRKEVLNDKIANAFLKEEITQLDEFKIIGQTFDKLKKFGRGAITWLKNLINKIMKKVKDSLEKIKKLGAKMFQSLFKFLGIELQKVTESVPNDISGFVYGMSD